ncbi:TPA: GNAT family N-acetyltransferase [Streptococcus pyogenes]|nr:GNAT family N-acetyltransferase [Streptococcus pyogenes]HER1460980.1 GNAT family N-acetyltransferase [Streptococcus pyogenes]
MNYRTISLDEIMKYLEKEEIQQLLKSFKGFNDGTSTPHDVEVFLHQKAVEFERSAIASTYLVFSTDSRELVGFFSLANRPLGKNYKSNTSISGKELLTLACDKVKKASKIINTKYIWLECDNNPKLIQFYQNFGFTPIDNFESENGLKVFVMKIQK